MCLKEHRLLFAPYAHWLHSASASHAHFSITYIKTSQNASFMNSKQNAAVRVNNQSNAFYNFYGRNSR